MRTIRLTKDYYLSYIRNLELLNNSNRTNNSTRMQENDTKRNSSGENPRMLDQCMLGECLTARCSHVNLPVCLWASLLFHTGKGFHETSYESKLTLSPPFHLAVPSFLHLLLPENGAACFVSGRPLPDVQSSCQGVGFGLHLAKAFPSACLPNVPVRVVGDFLFLPFKGLKPSSSHTLGCLWKAPLP